MTIINKYIAREILKCFGMVLVTIICIYITVDFIEKVDDFIEAKLPISKAVIYLLYKLPFTIAQIIPVGILMSVLIVIGLMRKNYEIIALKSSGIDIKFILKPVLAIGFFLSIFLFFLSEVIVPITMDKANQIWFEEVRKQSVATSKKENLWIKSNRLIKHIKYYNPGKKTVRGITIYEFDDDFKLIQRVDAQKGIYKNGQWVLYDTISQTLDKKNGYYNVESHEKKPAQIDLSPDNLKKYMKKSDEMSLTALLTYIRNVEAEGYDATSYRVDLYSKIAFPCVCFIMCLLGTGIAVRRNVNEGMLVSISYGIGIVFLYWIFYRFCQSLGYGEMLPPIAAAWIANIIFLCSGALTMIIDD